MKKLLIVLLLLFITSSVLYSQDDSDLKAKFNELNKKFSQMVVDNDLEGLLSYYAEDPISMPSYQPMLRGLDAMRESHKQQHQMGMKVTAFEITATDVIVEGNIAVEIGTYTVSMQIPGMDIPWADNGKYMNVWEVQDDGSYKIKVDTWNTDNNPWTDMNKEEDHEKPVEKLETEDKK